MPTYDVSLSDRTNYRTGHQQITAESMGEAIVAAERMHPGLLVNRIFEMSENIYSVELLYRTGTTRMYNTIKAHSEAEATRIAKLRNPSHDVVSIQRIG